MRISQLRLAGQGHWPDLLIERMDPRLNAFYAPTRAGKSSVAGLIGHLLYGKVDHPWSRYQEPTHRVIEGSLRVESAQGQFVLRRRDNANAHGKLTIAAVDGTSVTERTLAELLSDLSPRLLARMLAVDFREPADAAWLLEEMFARHEMFLPIGRTKHCPTCSGNGPASDLLTELTGGELVQIRLPRGGQSVMILDRNHRARPLSSLTLAEHDQLCLAITLALYDTYSRQGVELPLVLDEPFRRQNRAAAVAMARVLAEFAHAGRQVLVFTANHAALDCWNKTGTLVHNLAALRRHEQERQPVDWSQHQPEPIVPTPRPVQVEKPVPVQKPVQATKKTETKTTTSVRVVRDTVAQPSRELRLASVDSALPDDDFFFLSESSKLDDFPVLGDATGALFGQLEIYSVGDLLTADSADVARRLDRKEIHADTVQLWQTHMLLMCHVPGLTLVDAQVLSAVGIQTPDDLIAAEAGQLLQQVERFLSSDEGRRFASSRRRLTSGRFSAWRASALRHRRGWERRRSSYGWLKPVRTNGSRNGSSSRRSSSSGVTKKTLRTSELRFYLDLEDDVEKAPSIGPKTAERLLQVGIRSVADLLNADPESTAEELATSHIKPETLAAWQHQARLCCRIPKLRGYGAQLLVACGYTEPEQIAGTDASEVMQELLAFCSTKEGQRILRNGDAPDREKIEEWIVAAGYARLLEAV